MGTEQAIAKLTSSSAKYKNNNQLVLLFQIQFGNNFYNIPIIQDLEINSLRVFQKCINNHYN